MELNADISPIKKGINNFLNDSTAHKEPNEDQDNSHDSTEGYMSYIGKVDQSTTILTGNELMNYMINTLNSTNTHMQHKLKDSINLTLFDHLSQIKANSVNKKREEPKVIEEEIKKEKNPFIYPNEYNLLTAQGKYEIFAEIRDRTDKRTQKLQEVIENMYSQLPLFNDASPYMNIISEQRNKFQSLKQKSESQANLEEKLSTTEGGITDNCFTVRNYASSLPMNSSTDFGEKKVIDNRQKYKEGDLIVNESFHQPEQQEIFKKTLNDKNDNNNFQSTTSNDSYGRVLNGTSNLESTRDIDITKKANRNESTGNYSEKKKIIAVNEKNSGNSNNNNNIYINDTVASKNNNYRQQLLYSDKKSTKNQLKDSYKDSIEKFDIKKVTSK